MDKQHYFGSYMCLFTLFSGFLYRLIPEQNSFFTLRNEFYRYIFSRGSNNMGLKYCVDRYNLLIIFIKVRADDDHRSNLVRIRRSKLILCCLAIHAAW